MNVLIIGEFSAFAKHLKNGFERLGHRVIITLTGDGWKNLSATGEDILYSERILKFRGKVIPGSSHLFAPKTNSFIERELNKRFQDKIDLIIVVNYSFLSSNRFQTGVSLKFVKNQLTNGAKLIMMVCGGDPSQQYSFPDYYKNMGYNIPMKDERFDFLLRNAHVVVPTIYSYYYSVKLYCEKFGYSADKIYHAIPLPMTLDSYEIHTCINRKIVIFHGVIRPVSKGTPIIKAAMNRIQHDFPDRVECVCKGGLPYDEYVKLFDSVDILIEQTYHNGWGMNAAIGAMKGKCVLAPCGPENEENMGIEYIPFVRIGPDCEQIYQALKELILNPERIDQIKSESRRFVENHCECSIVAKDYLKSVGF